MKTKQLAKETSPKKPQAANRAPFCLRLNALRALACISVICTHIVGFHNIRGGFRSMDYGGHMAVYFFFSLSGYLLSLSLVKEVKRRVNDHKPSNSLKKAGDEGRRLMDQKPQANTDSGEKDQLKEASDSQNSPLTKIDMSNSVELNVAPREEELMTKRSWGEKICGMFSLTSWLEWVQGLLIVSILSKYLWNRTWRLFPLYYGCWCFLKFFSVPNTHVHSLQTENLWENILQLRTFPGHLWTMRIEMMYYYYVIPLYICALYVAFSLQKKGLHNASVACFSAIIGALLYTATGNMIMDENIIHPVKLSDRFPENLPPFCFGMLAALANYALELRLNARQAAKAKVSASVQIQLTEEQVNEIQVPETSFSIEAICQRVCYGLKYGLSLVNKNMFNIIFVVVFCRILLLNPGVVKSLFTASDKIPVWQMSNLHSYWYAIFILINDSRGGFWKLTHPNPEPKSSSLHPSFLHKIIYYFGLWSYPIYLTHPISYVTLSRHFPKTKMSLEVNVLAVFACLVLGGICDYLFDKILVNKVILGKIFAVKKAPVPAKSS